MTSIGIIDLLKSYSVCKKFIQSQEYAEEFFNPSDTHSVNKKEIYEARMHVIEALIQSLEPSNEYTLLHLHYIKGLPVEKCAECMLISRSTAFRMLKRAHESIYDLVNKKEYNMEDKND